MKGPARNAYAALVAGSDRDGLGPLAWLARTRQVRWVCNLIEAQRRVLAALGVLHDEQPDLVARWLRRDRHPGAYWAFVILYTATRFEPSRPAAPLARVRSEHEPEHPLPDWYTWMQSWGHALIMNPARVTPFFMHRFAPLLSRHFESPAGDSVTMPAHAPGFLCPTVWDRWPQVSQQGSHG